MVKDNRTAKEQQIIEDWGVPPPKCSGCGGWIGLEIPMIIHNGEFWCFKCKTLTPIENAKEECNERLSVFSKQEKEEKP